MSETHEQQKSVILVFVVSRDWTDTLLSHYVTVNGLYTPFGSPVHRGTETPNLGEQLLSPSSSMI